MVDIDSVRLNLNNDGINILKGIIALIMFAVALDLKPSDFTNLIKNPKGLVAGFLSQFVIFPLFTYLMIVVMNVKPSIALGLVMIAACPGGSMSNLLTSLGRGNVALSVGLTSLSTILSMVATPFFLVFIGDKIPETRALLTEIHVGKWEMLEGVFLILGIPMGLGMLSSKFLPNFSEKFQKIMKKVSVVFLGVFIIGALSANFKYFTEYFGILVGVVFVHSTLALMSGYLAAKIMRVSNYDMRAITMEVGIKNSALGLALVFQFFQGMGGMAMIVAWWGVWQTIAGLILIQFWKIKEKKKVLA